MTAAQKVRLLEIAIPPRAGHFSTLHLLASLRGQGAPKNLQCALPGSDFQFTQRFQSTYAVLRLILPFGRLRAGSMPVMVSLSNHARALPLELFKEAAPEQQILKPVRESGRSA